MDLGFDNNYGESWLIYEKETRTIHRVEGDPKSIPHLKKSKKLEDYGKLADAAVCKYVDSFCLDYYSDLTVDTCMSSNRLLVLRHETLRPEVDTKMDKEER
ncbi:MAG: hypothetical protein IJX93_10630 [Clostridia bacterium]|nr:hypothetical protein [Clostridia bacterium]